MPPMLNAGKTTTSWRRRTPWASISSLHLLILISVASAQDYTCDLLNDKCPTSGNDQCESSLSSTPSSDPACRNGDCLDCNFLCQQFDYDCTGCLSTAGCYWCPGDATCNNSPHYLFSATSSCNAPQDYIAAPNAGRCSISGSLFRYERGTLWGANQRTCKFLLLTHSIVFGFFPICI